MHSLQFLATLLVHLPSFANAAAITKPITNCNDVQVAAVLGQVTHPAYFCTWYLAYPRSESPIISLSLSEAEKACECLVAVAPKQTINNKVTTISKLATCGTDETGVKGEFKNPKTFCNFFSDWSHTASPVSDMSVEAVHHGCGCVLLDVASTSKKTSISKTTLTSKTVATGKVATATTKASTSKSASTSKTTTTIKKSSSSSKKLFSSSQHLSSSVSSKNTLTSGISSSTKALGTSSTTVRVFSTSLSKSGTSSVSSKSPAISASYSSSSTTTSVSAPHSTSSALSAALVHSTIHSSSSLSTTSLTSSQSSMSDLTTASVSAALSSTSTTSPLPVSTSSSTTSASTVSATEVSSSLSSSSSSVSSSAASSSSDASFPSSASPSAASSSTYASSPSSSYPVDYLNGGSSLSSTTASAAATTTASNSYGCGSTYTTTDGSTWSVECDVDYPGTDIKSIETEDVYSCIQACDDYGTDCVGIVWPNSDGDGDAPCYLKNSLSSYLNDGYGGGVPDFYGVQRLSDGSSTESSPSSSSSAAASTTHASSPSSTTTASAASSTDASSPSSTTAASAASSTTASATTQAAPSVFYLAASSSTTLNGAYAYVNPGSGHLHWGSESEANEFAFGPDVSDSSAELILESTGNPAYLDSITTPATIDFTSSDPSGAGALLCGYNEDNFLTCYNEDTGADTFGVYCNGDTDDHVYFGVYANMVADGCGIVNMIIDTVGY